MFNWFKKKEKRHGPPHYFIDRVYTWLGNFIYPVSELYPGFYHRYWTRWNRYGASTEYEALLGNIRLSGVRLGLTRDLGPLLSRWFFRLALVSTVAVCAVSVFLFRTQLGALA